MNRQIILSRLKRIPPLKTLEAFLLNQNVICLDSLQTLVKRLNEAKAVREEFHLIVDFVEEIDRPYDFQCRNYEDCRSMIRMINISDYKKKEIHFDIAAMNYNERYVLPTIYWAIPHKNRYIYCSECTEERNLL